MSLDYRPLCAALILCLAAGAAEAAKKKSSKPAVAPTPSACTDFYQHVNQPWLAAHPLPPGAPSYSRWDELNTSALKEFRSLLSGTGPAPTGVASRLLADLVASGSDASAMDAGVLATAQPLLAQVNAIRKPKDIARVIAALHAAGVPVLFGFDALRDPNTGQARASFYPAGLGLPGPAFYGSPANELQKANSLYRAYLAEQLKFAGVAAEKTSEQAGWALDIENSLARAMGGSLQEQTGPAPLNKAYPSLQLADFMQAQGSAPALIVVQQPEFFRTIDRMLAKPQVPQWQAYLRTQVLHSLAPARGRDPRQPYLVALSMTPPIDLSPADRLGLVSFSDAAELTSAAYAESFLTSAQAQHAAAIAEAVRAAMGRAIDRSVWLSATGKTESRAKLAAMRISIGEAAEPVSFAGLSFDRRNLAANLLGLRRWNRARSLARLSSAVWPAPVSQAQPTIGYQQGENRLVVTAAVLRPPVLEGTSPASDYGALGALIAQQMSLGFADYTDADGRALASRQAGLVPQYASYAASPTVKVNATRMLRQNAADLAAIEIAWDAFVASGAPDAEAKKNFYRAWAMVWARQDNPTALASAQSTSAFSPARWRVNGPLINQPSFEQAFACKTGQAMFKTEKDQLAIWR